MCRTYARRWIDGSNESNRPIQLHSIHRTNIRVGHTRSGILYLQVPGISYLVGTAVCWKFQVPPAFGVCLGNSVFNKISHCNETTTTLRFFQSKTRTIDNMDVEASRTQRGGAVNNPYSDMPPTMNPVNVLRRGFYMGGSLYGLHYYDTYNTIMTSPKVSHEWLKVALATSIGESWEYGLSRIEGANKWIRQ
jgi:hypothetical protein